MRHTTITLSALGLLTAVHPNLGVATTTAPTLQGSTACTVPTSIPVVERESYAFLHGIEGEHRFRDCALRVNFTQVCDASGVLQSLGLRVDAEKAGKHGQVNVDFPPAWESFRWKLENTRMVVEWGLGGAISGDIERIDVTVDATRAVDQFRVQKFRSVFGIKKYEWNVDCKK